MKNRFNLMKVGQLAAPLALALSVFASPSLQAGATIPGITGPNFNLVAAEDYLTTPDGGSVYVWGYGNANNATMQYPGLTLIVNQGDVVTVTLTNNLWKNTSIVFPGQEGVTANCNDFNCADGLLAKEALPSGTVTYTFTATKPGTYLYHSGTRPDLQTEMGLVGALIVRPNGYNENAPTAYGHAGSGYDHEYLSLLTEMDVRIHQEVETGAYDTVDTRDYKPVWWFINGRNGVDTVSADNNPLLPNQPYGSIIRTRPGEKVLLRLIGAGRDPHPYHTHGNHFTLLAKDARMFESNPGVSGPDRTTPGFTNETFPGETYDMLFSWTGSGLGWDMYGYTHATQPTYCDASDNATVDYPADKMSQSAADRCKALPVVLPGLQELTFGPFYSGSPYLGNAGALPPGEGGFNANNGYFFMWHSHSERELVNFNIFPGGMLTFLIVEPPGTPIP
ncbi:multicopper oxidase domain-containing protein [Methyloglobulus sp.]|uniref:multicopper oxidase domain-containing protein n=1 Tax=Methyloglobulus sp. TaxID=2518622 RepID=UPI0032B768FF